MNDRKGGSLPNDWPVKKDLSSSRTSSSSSLWPGIAGGVMCVVLWVLVGDSVVVVVDRSEVLFSVVL